MLRPGTPYLLLLLYLPAGRWKLRTSLRIHAKHARKLGKGDELK